MAAITNPTKEPGKAVKAVPAAKKENGDKETVGRTPVLSQDAHKIKGIVYWEKAGNPPCVRDHSEEDPGCALCAIQDQCKSLTEAARKPALVPQMPDHPKANILKKQDWESGFQEARKHIAVERLATAEILYRLWTGLSAETFEEQSFIWLGLKPTQLKKLVRFWVTFGALPKDQVLQMMQNFGTQEKAMISMRHVDPIGLGMAGTIPVVANGKKTQKKIADLSDKEFEAALRTTPGTRTRVSPVDVNPDKSKARPVPLLRTMTRPLMKSMTVFESSVEKSRGISSDEVVEVDTAIEKFEKMLDLLKSLRKKLSGPGKSDQKH